MSRQKYKGLQPYRFRNNPEEKRFANAWARENETGKVLAYLLDSQRVDGGRPVDPSDRDIVVSSTVIQWLGSPVGQFWLGALGYEKKKA